LTGVYGTVQNNYFRETNFLSLYYQTPPLKGLKTSLPLFFPNATRVEDGRRAIISPVKTDTSRRKINLKNPFNAAVLDLVGMCTEYDQGKSISLGEATNLSELFPFINSTVYISKNTGSFMDGGAYENLGLSTLYEVRMAADQIRQNPDGSWMKNAFPDVAQREEFARYLGCLKFKILLIYNLYNHGEETHALYDPHMQMFDPINTLMKTPFGGHTDYVYHKVKSEFGDEDVRDFQLMNGIEQSGHKADKIIMSRWLSKYEFDSIMARAVIRSDSSLIHLDLKRTK
jgi:hypothetical protein